MKSRTLATAFADDVVRLPDAAGRRNDLHAAKGTGRLGAMRCVAQGYEFRASYEQELKREVALRVRAKERGRFRCRPGQPAEARDLSVVCILRQHRQPDWRSRTKGSGRIGNIPAIRRLESGTRKRSRVNPSGSCEGWPPPRGHPVILRNNRHSSGFSMM